MQPDEVTISVCILFSMEWKGKEHQEWLTGWQADKYTDIQMLSNQ